MTSFWDTSRPAKPVGLFDIDSTRRIQIDWSDWLEMENTTYVSHQLIADDPLEVESTEFIHGVIIVYIKVKEGEVFELNSKRNIVCRITTADGQVEDQTVILKAVQK